MNLTTLESAARLLEVDLAEMDGETKAQLEAGIAEVSARAGAFCNRTFQREERGPHHDGGGRYLSPERGAGSGNQGNPLFLFLGMGGGHSLRPLRLCPGQPEIRHGGV